MPLAPIPARFTPILESTTLGHLATVDDHGLPEVNPVWFLWDGEHLLLSVRAETRKYRHLRRDPHLAISLLDPTNPQHYLELRGEVVAFERFDTLDFVDLLSVKYTGVPYSRSHRGEERYKLTIQINRWTGQ